MTTSAASSGASESARAVHIRIPAGSEANAQPTACWVSSVARSSGAASSSAAASRRLASAWRPRICSTWTSPATSAGLNGDGPGGSSASTSISASRPSSSRPGVGERDRLGGEQAAAALGLVVGQQPRRGAVPAGRGGGRGRGGGGGRLAEQRDRGLVARPRELLDVVGADARRGAAGREHAGDALVGAEPPGGRRAVVDRAQHQRVAEAERPGVVARPDEVGGDEPVERCERLGGVQRGGRGGELRVERVAGHGGAVDQRARGGRQRVDLELDRGEERLGQRAGRVARRAGQLLEEERVAARVAGDAVAQRRVGDLARERERCLVVERLHRDELGAGAGAHGVEQPARRVDRAHGEAEQHGAGGRAAQQVQDELHRGLVRPVHVVEEQRDRALAGDHRQQRAQRTVVAEALRRIARRGGGHAALGDRGALGSTAASSGPIVSTRRWCMRRRRGRRARRRPARRGRRARARRRGPPGRAGPRPPRGRAARAAARSCRSRPRPSARAPAGRPRRPRRSRRSAAASSFSRPSSSMSGRIYLSGVCAGIPRWNDLAG